MKIKHIALTIMAIAAISSCAGLQPEEVLLPRMDISLTMKEEQVMTFDPATCQIGYNSGRNEFRLINDKLNDWVIFRSSATPTDVGQEVKASLEYTSQDSTKKLENLTFRVEKTAPDGMVWLWNKDKKIGIIIKIL